MLQEPPLCFDILDQQRTRLCIFEHILEKGVTLHLEDDGMLTQAVIRVWGLVAIVLGEDRGLGLLVGLPVLHLFFHHVFIVGDETLLTKHLALATDKNLLVLVEPSVFGQLLLVRDVMDLLIEDAPDAPLRRVSLQEVLHPKHLVGGRYLRHSPGRRLDLAMPHEVNKVVEDSFLNDVGTLDQIHSLHSTHQLPLHVLRPMGEERYLTN